MPTPDELREWRALRGRFLNALWDAEHAGTDYPNVSDLLQAAGSPDLPAHQIDRLIETLDEDGLIEGITMAEGSAQQVHLTSYGREELERWLAEPERPTEHLPLPANQVFNIGSMNVTGPVLQGSTATNVTTTYGVSGDALARGPGSSSPPAPSRSDHWRSSRRRRNRCQGASHSCARRRSAGDHGRVTSSR
jgi:hypothetical protein